MTEALRRCPGDACTWTTSDWTRCPAHDRCAVPVSTLQPLKRAPHLGWLLDGRYALLELKGIGGFGAVYRACDVKMHNQVVAVKLLLQARADDQARFDREMKILAGLTHPTLLAISDRGEEQIGGTHCVFMVGEYLPHGSLAERLKAGGALSLADAVRVIEQTAEGLACAHDAGVIHRDLKPGNLMLTAGPDDPIGIKIIDFGIAKVTDATETRGPPIGTIQYMSPEQIHGEQLTPASDVYALGIVLYEMLVGRRPFGGVPKFIEGQHIHSAPPHLPAYDSDYQMGRVDAVIQRALAKAPTDRYPSMLAFSAALTQAASEAEPPSRTRTQPQGGPPSPGRPLPPVKTAAQLAVQTGASAELSAQLAEVPTTRESHWARIVVLIGVLAILGGIIWFAASNPSDLAVRVDATVAAGPDVEVPIQRPPSAIDQRIPDAKPRDAGPSVAHVPDAQAPKAPVTLACTAADIDRIEARLRKTGCRRFDEPCTLAEGIDPLLRQCRITLARRKCLRRRAQVKKAPYGKRCRALIQSPDGKQCNLMALPGRCGYCGDGIKNGNEDCDGSAGCTKDCLHDY